MDKLIQDKRKQILTDYVDSRILYDIKEIENYLKYYNYCIEFTQKVNKNPTLKDDEFLKIQKLIDEKLKVLSEKDWKNPIQPEKKFELESFIKKMNQIQNQLKYNINSVDKIEDIEKPTKINSSPVKNESKTEMNHLRQNWKVALEELREIETKIDKLRGKTLIYLQDISENLKKGLKPNSFTSLTENVVQFYESEKLLKQLSKEKDNFAFGSQFIKSNL